MAMGQSQWLEPSEARRHFARWVEAAASEHGSAQGEFLAAYEANRQNAAQIVGRANSRWHRCARC